jgi:hypothetical protein
LTDLYGSTPNKASEGTIWWDDVEMVEPVAKRPRLNDDDDNDADETGIPVGEDAASKEFNHTTYWESESARELFAPYDNQHPGSPTHTRDHIKKRIELLTRAGSTLEGWQYLIENGDPYNAMTDYDKFVVTKRSAG